MPDRAKGADMPSKEEKYTELDVELMLQGAENVNRWKREIHSFLSIFLSETSRDRFSCPVPTFAAVNLGELRDDKGALLLLCWVRSEYYKTKIVVSSSVPEVVGHFVDGFLLFEFGQREILSTVSSLPLNYVLPIRQALSRFASAIYEKFPQIDNRLRQFRELGTASLDCSQIG